MSRKYMHTHDKSSIVRSYFWMPGIAKAIINWKSGVYDKQDFGTLQLVAFQSVLPQVFICILNGQVPHDNKGKQKE